MSAGVSSTRKHLSWMHAVFRAAASRSALIRDLELADAGWWIVGLFFASRVLMFVVFAIDKGTFSPGVFVDALCQWDCGWFLHTAQNGYDAAPHAHPLGNAANWAFFPFYPMLIRLVASVSGLGFPWSGVVVSNAAALAVGLIVLRLFSDVRVALVFAVLFYFGPFSFYFASVYAEAVYFLLTVSSLYFLSRRSYLAAAIPAALMSATRPQGVLMALTLVVSVLCDHVRDGGSVWTFPRFVLGNPRLLLAIFLAPLGGFLYMAFMYLHVGDALAFSHIQRAWDREFGNPIEFLWRDLTANDLRQFFRIRGGVSWQWCALWALVGFVLAGYLVRLRRYPEAVFSLLSLIIPLSMGGAFAMPRYAIGTAPLLLLSAQLLAQREWSRTWLLAVFVLANVPLLVLWAEGHVSLI